MQRIVDVSLVLRVYEKITRLGTKHSDGYLYEGLNANSDWDGYTITVSNQQLGLSIFFHNNYQFSVHDEKVIDTFIKQLERIDKSQVS
ncbi:DUF3081 domain-containing protein [Agarivorans sp. TSD2052]|uniref:DUF3081 family protein n=1 Tax=Agarivorans sp. TSD2052 TaxID=2937286 RepID=UPI00200CF5CA|nr:DUF3081 family protein [Agarivorans sp. TSD2052]UPW19723.1 DUF3081 domain-containing protein [Agarivorans sp. TSD2052]